MTDRLSDLEQRVKRLEASREADPHGGLALFESEWICREAGKGNWGPWKERNRQRRREWQRRRKGRGDGAAA